MNLRLIQNDLATYLAVTVNLYMHTFKRLIIMGCADGAKLNNNKNADDYPESPQAEGN